MLKKFLIGALVAFPAIVLAAVSISVSWTPPTALVDGSPIVDPITYNVYAGPSGAEVKVHTGLTSTQDVLSATANVQQCATVTAVVNSVESAQSPEGCATKGFPAPNAPGKPTLK